MFFFDIDGTLMDRRTKEIAPSTQLALGKLGSARHFVGIATGCAHYKAVDFIKAKNILKEAEQVGHARNLPII